MQLFRIILLTIFLKCIFAQTLFSATLQGRIFCKENGEPYRKKLSINIVGFGEFQTDNDGYYSKKLSTGMYLFKIDGEQFKVYVYKGGTRRDFYVPCKIRKQ